MAAEQWCRAAGVDCLYALIPLQEIAGITGAIRRGAVPVDVRLEFALTADRLPAQPAPVASIRDAAPADLHALREMAAAGYEQTRFFADRRFARERAAALYVRWIERSVEGWAARVFVADHGGRAAGFVTCHADDGSGRIGLIGVAPAARGQGIGASLVAAAARWCFDEQGLSVLTVVTQGRNVDAQRLYQRAGFVTTTAGLWCHRWFTTEGVEDRS
jgi:dTDP-4-amino-4,6-dideoxy-D-galactose acyltransferase